MVGFDDGITRVVPTVASVARTPAVATRTIEQRELGMKNTTVVSSNQAVKNFYLYLKNTVLTGV